MSGTSAPEFIPPPEAPVFEPTEEEFQNPLEYIAKIRPIAEKTGICKIKPPSHWQPPFAVDVDTFKFTPRVQKLNELEAKTRTKLNFLDNLAKFWELQGCHIRIPNVERKHLDLFDLRRIVHENGGYDIVCKERLWAKVAHQLDYPTGKGVGSTLRTHYEKILFPYDVFKSGATFDPADLEIHSSPQKNKAKKEKEVKQETPKKAEKETPKKREVAPTVTIKEEVIEPAPMSPTRSEEGTGRRSRRIVKEEPPEETESLDSKEPNTDYSANPELKKLQFYGAGPKMAIPAGSTKDEPEEEQQATSTVSLKGKRRKVTMRTRKRNKNVTYVDHYMCHTCGRGDCEESMLLCDGCDDAFHLFCLIPPMVDVPKGDWRCPKCVAKECKKALDPYGFEQAKKEYTLQSFGEMADQFKADYFNMPVHMVPCDLAEKEFWRLVDCVDEDVIIEYGADIHAADCGSGFPTQSTADQFPEDEDYIKSGWNLNNLPVAPESVLQHITADISGMKVPWCYVGMCFSSFCWHIEDHWSYSINYNHWGEPKTWYGVPGSKAELLEECMKKNAPELFEQAPDLLHQLTTIINPNILMAYGVPIVRTNQCAGEYVITFPRSYHAGFNQGYNFAEAVNFCPADWLPIGRACIDHYRLMRRQCVFSHEELICKMAADPDSLDLVMAAATHGDMLSMVEREKKMRKRLLDMGITEAEREAFELLPDDERQCDFCKTTCFLSAVTCPCSPDKLVCIEHVEDLCNCATSRQCLRYRYTLDELPAMLHRLKIRAEAFDNWAYKVRKALDAPQADKLELQDLKNMIKEAEEKKFPTSALLQTLTSAVNEAEKCANVANQLVSKKVRTRHRQSGDGKYVAKLSLSELQCFSDQVNNLPCHIKEAELITDLLQKVSDFQIEARNALDEEAPDSIKLDKLVEFAINLDVDLPEIPKLKLVLQQAKWLDNVRNTMSEPGDVTLETMRKLIESGVALAPHPACEKAMAELQELLTLSERWEEKARVCIQAKPRHAMSSLESIVIESKNIPAYLPNVSALKDCLRKAKEWIGKVESIQGAEQYPYLEMLEAMVNKGRPLSVRLDPLPQLESQVAAAKSWRERTARTFLKKNSTYTLVEVLSPRSDIGIYGMARKKKKQIKETPEKEKENNNAEETGGERRNPAAIVAMFKQAEEKEVEHMRELRTQNMEKNNQEGDDARYCTCRRGRSGHMLQCELCKDLFHSSCVPLPKTAQIKSKNSQAMLVQAARDMKFLCPHCLRSRRPRLETILSLLVSLQKLPVRLPEGEALQCLTERAMAWQDRARQSLATDELASALARLSSLSQKIVEQANREKTEKIISAEILKVTSNPDLVPSVPSVPASTLLGTALDSMAASIEGENLLNEAAPLSSEEAGSTDEMGDGDLFPVDFTGMSSEHAYSSASKGGLPTAAVPTLLPKKHARKSPLVPRKDSPVLELSDLAKAQLEELMMEGDLLEVSLDETQHIWRILQACQPRRDDMLPAENDNVDDPDLMRPKFNIPPKIEGLEKKKKKKRPKIEGMIEPGMEGLDKPKKKKIKLINKELKEKMKLKEGQKLPEGMEKKKKIKIRKKKKEGVEGLDRKKKPKLKDKMPQQMMMDDDNDDDDCAAIKCLKPTGEEVNWVQCDRCEQWFHMLCVGLAEEDISENEDYNCFNCRPSGNMRVTNGLAPLVMRRNSVDSEGSADVVVTDNGVSYTQEVPIDMDDNQKTEPPVTLTETKETPEPEVVTEKPTEVMETSESDPVDIMDIDESENKEVEIPAQMLQEEESTPEAADEASETKPAEAEEESTSVVEEKEVELSKDTVEVELSEPTEILTDIVYREPAVIVMQEPVLPSEETIPSRVDDQQV